MSETYTKQNFIKGSAKAIEFSDGGEIINLSLNKEELMALQGDYVQLTVKKRREADQYGNTHYVVENTYKPSPKKKAAVEDSFDMEDDGKDKLPF